MTPHAVAEAVHRLRARYRTHLESEVAQTTATPLEVEDELHYLIALLARSVG